MPTHLLGRRQPPGEGHQLEGPRQRPLVDKRGVDEPQELGGLGGGPALERKDDGRRQVPAGQVLTLCVSVCVCVGGGGSGCGEAREGMDE